MGMTLTKSFVNKCRNIGALRDFLCQAMDQVDEKDKEIAELEEQYKDMDVTHTVHITKMNALIEELEESQRWRKFSEVEPKEKQWILVFYPNHSQFTTGVELRRWDGGCKYDVEVQEIYDKWMPLPSAPKEGE